MKLSIIMSRLAQGTHNWWALCKSWELFYQKYVELVYSTGRAGHHQWKKLAKPSALNKSSKSQQTATTRHLITAIKQPTYIEHLPATTASSDMLLEDKPYCSNPSDWAECVILWTSRLQSPGKVSCRAVNIPVTWVGLRIPFLSANTNSLFTVLKSCSAEIIDTWHQWTESIKQESQEKDS